MVTTTSIAADHEAKRQRISFEKSKVVNVSIILATSHTPSPDKRLLHNPPFVSHLPPAIALKTTPDTATVCSS
jgi:hypothetical protein